MKLLRYGSPGQEKPDLPDDQGRVRDLSGAVADIAGRALEPRSIAALQALDPASLQPDDIISTGTPTGVGTGQKPPTYLRRGEVMRLGIKGLGQQTQKVVGA